MPLKFRGQPVHHVNFMIPGFMSYQTVPCKKVYYDRHLVFSSGDIELHYKLEYFCDNWPTPSSPFLSKIMIVTLDITKFLSDSVDTVDITLKFRNGSRANYPVQLSRSKLSTIERIPIEGQDHDSIVITEIEVTVGSYTQSIPIADYYDQIYSETWRYDYILIDEDTVTV